MSSCRVVECTLTVRYVGTHSFKPRPTANPLSLDHRRALIFSRPNLGQAQYRFLETSGGCPHPRDKPGHHPYPARSSDPPFVPHCARDGPDAVTSWHPYPLLAAQGLSLAADSVLRPVVDWFGAADVRLSRRVAPRDPWNVRWGPEHTSVVLPPIGYEEEALDKMIADGSQGIIFLPHDSLTRVQERATAHAAVRIDLAAHPDARVDARTSAP